MSTWGLMFLTSLIIPLLMLFRGRKFVKNPPEKVNKVFGYRTNKSMKNQETWEFAHRLYGKLLLRAGRIALPVSAGLLLCFLPLPLGRVIILGLAVLIAQMLTVLALFIPVEKALAAAFDENGQRRDTQ